MMMMMMMMMVRDKQLVETIRSSTGVLTDNKNNEQETKHNDKQNTYPAKYNRE